MKKLLMLVAAAWVINELFLKSGSSSSVYAPAPDRLENLRYGGVDFPVRDSYSRPVPV